MPIGYVSDLYKGKQSARDVKKYIIDVARGYGMFMHLRDDPNKYYTKDDLMPPKDTYAKDHLYRAKEDLQNLKAMTREEVEEAYLDHVREVKQKFEKQQEEKKKLADRYDAMMEALDNWNPNKDVSFLKTACKKYVKDSKDFDCEKEHEPKIEKTPEEWYAKQLTKCQRDIEYYTEEAKKDEERYNERCALIDSLFECLPDEKLPASLFEDDGQSLE